MHVYRAAIVAAFSLLSSFAIAADFPAPPPTPSRVLMLLCDCWAAAEAWAAAARRAYLAAWRSVAADAASVAA